MKELFSRLFLCLTVILALVYLNGCSSSTGTLARPEAYESEAMARTTYEKALSKNPQDALAHQWMGLLLLHRGETKDGEDYLLKAVALDASLTESYLKLGELAEEAGRPEQALDYYNKAIQGNRVFSAVTQRKTGVERRRSSATRRLGNANALLMEGRYQEALDILETTKKDLPGEPRVGDLMARAYVALARIEQDYALRKQLLHDGRTSLTEVREPAGSSGAATLLSEIETLLAEDEEQVARARESVESGRGTFRREVCLSHKAPVVEIRNTSRSEANLDLGFRDGVTQWVVSADGASLRSGPGREYDRIAGLSRGVPLWVKVMGEEYYHVITPSGEGWMSKRLLGKERMVKLPIPAGRSVSVILAPGRADFRLGRGIKSIAEGDEEFLPYLCYYWP